MTILWGDTGKVAIGINKKFTVSITPNETVLGTTVNLPTTSPANGQFSYTVSSYLPTVTPAFYSTSYLPMIYGAGQNTTASAITLYWEVDKNGASVGSGSTSVPANNYWTLNFNTDICTNTSDTYAVKLYGSATGLTLTYQAIAVYPVRFLVSKYSTILQDLTYTMTAPSLTANASNAINDTGNWYIYTDGNSNTMPALSPATFSAFRPGNSTYNMGTTREGEIGFKNNVLTSTTQIPKYNRNNYPSTITFREVLRW